MSNPAHQPASRMTIRDYLTAAYVVEPGEVNAGIERHPDIVEDAIRFGSHAYFAGDQIADAEGWPTNADFDIDEDEDEWEDED
jgi:hypothetical protein